MKIWLLLLSMISTLLGTTFLSPLHAAADASFVSAHFTGSGQCAQCHDGISDNQGKDISIIKNWSSSMMANSTRDPYWRAKVASELHRNPSISAEINDKCSRCHAPMANDSAKKDGATIKILGDGFLNPNNPYYNHALDGVSCTACHQISDNGKLGTLEGVSGRYTILQYANATDRPAFGQYANPTTGPMRNNVSFTPTHGSHISTSEMCASCHDVKTPFVDASGSIVSTTLASEFPEQMVYSEWNNSAFKTGGVQEKSCQSCHMPKIEGSVKIANRPGFIDARPNFAEHTFLGANTTMLDILNTNREALEVTATGFEQSIIDTRALLKSAASLNVISKEIVGNQLKVVLKVTNHAGHKLPSSYPSRRAFIHFTVRDNTGNTVFESGKMNANGSIVNVAGDSNSNTYEPHYDVITSEDQVQVYSPIMQNTDGAVTHTLMRAAAYKKDNRIPPAGFNKASVPNDVAVVGAARNDSNFTDGSDTITYLIEVGDKRNFSIEASLNYQTLAYGHLQDMFKDAASVSEVASFKSQFENAGIRSETIAEATTVFNDGSSSAAPVASNSSLTTSADTAISRQFTATDADNDVLFFTLVSNGTKGTAVISNASTGAFTYTPASGQTGQDTLTFSVSDGTSISNTATVSITIDGGSTAGSSGGGGSLSWYSLLLMSLLLGIRTMVRRATRS